MDLDMRVDGLFSDDENILDRLPDPAENKKVIFIINKVDTLKDKRQLLPVMEKANKLYPFDEVVPMCALRQNDLDQKVSLSRADGHRSEYDLLRK